jgi:hypothetical protein
MRLRFSIRELLLVTFIFALALGWWLDHRRLYREHFETLNHLRGTLSNSDSESGLYPRQEPDWATIQNLMRLSKQLDDLIKAQKD